MNVLKFAVVVCLLAVTPALAWAEPEHAKLNTEDAGTVDPGHWELELSYSFTQARRSFDDHWSSGARSLLKEQEVGLGIKYGVAENLDVGLAIGYADIYDRDTGQLTGRGITDLELGAKWRFYHNEARRLEIAYTPAVTLPTGRRENSDRVGITDDYVSIYNGIALSKDWSERWTSNFDVGYNWPVGEDRHDSRGTLSANAALGCQIADWLQPEVELNYAHDFNHGDDADAVAATAGLTMPVRDNVRVDLGVQRALCGRNAEHGMTLMAGLTLTY